MPIFKTKHENFFKDWTPEMAYVLGFFTADGNMIRNKRGAHFITIEITDKEIIEKIQIIIGSNHKISARNKNAYNPKWKTTYRLQIGSKEMFNDLIRLGMTPNKSNTIDFPLIPNEYLAHFIRGYFDGDGCVNCGIYNRKDRKTKKCIFTSRFTSGSKIFLESLLKKLRSIAIIKGGFIYNKNRGFELVLSTNDTKALFSFMYKEVDNNLFLERKYKKFCEGLELLKNHKIQLV